MSHVHVKNRRGNEWVLDNEELPLLSPQGIFFLSIFRVIQKRIDFYSFKTSGLEQQLNVFFCGRKKTSIKKACFFGFICVVEEKYFFFWLYCEAVVFPRNKAHFLVLCFKVEVFGVSGCCYFVCSGWNKRSASLLGNIVLSLSWKRVA